MLLPTHALKDSAPGSSGCLIVNLSVDSARRPEGLDVRIARVRQSLPAALEVALARAEAQAEVRPGDVPARRSVLVALAVNGPPAAGTCGRPGYWPDGALAAGRPDRSGRSGRRDIGVGSR